MIDFLSLRPTWFGVRWLCCSQAPFRQYSPPRPQLRQFRLSSQWVVIRSRRVSSPALTGPNNPNAETRSADLRAAAGAIGQQIHIFNANSESEIENSFAALVQLGAGALLVGDDPFFESRRVHIITLAAHHAVPAIYETRDYTSAGGVMSYGASFADAYRQAGIYTGRILKGVKPADLPVMQPTKFELVINLKAAKALGLTIPPMLLARADEVIE